MLWKTRENTSESRKSTSSEERVIRLDPRPLVAKAVSKQMRHRPATGAASFVGLWSCLAAARSGKTTVLVADSAHRECHGYQYWLQKRDSKNHFSASPAASHRPQPAQADWAGGRNARATGTHSRAFPNSRWQFTLENCQSATGVTAIISWQALRLTTYSLHPLCSGMFEAATEKQFPLVQKLWTTKLPCGGLRKTAEESQEGT
jgi:hypothetical protein